MKPNTKDISSLTGLELKAIVSKSGPITSAFKAAWAELGRREIAKLSADFKADTANGARPPARSGWGQVAQMHRVRP